MNTRSASFFARLSKTSSDIRVLESLIKSTKIHEENLVKNRDEMDRVYRLIEESARKGAIRIFVPREDPLWENHTVQLELKRQGFSLNKYAQQKQGVVEWYNVVELA